MNKNIAFTICAKNYLAQAITLKESALFHNQELDFCIFLSDTPDGLDSNIDIRVVDETIVPDIEKLAFKYDVVEYSTAVKPYVIKKLFNEGYEKVMYIDPDIFVTNSLDYVIDNLDRKSVILTPHRCTTLTEDQLAPEKSILYNGIFNLGFLAIKNDVVGNELIDWWKEKLYSECYMEVSEALAVDQKWMEFAVSYYPENVLISHNMGLNVASWNIHERQLEIRNGEYVIRSMKDPNKVDSLLFFHFSSFNPKIRLLIKSNASTTFENYPNLETLADEYIGKLLINGYDSFSKMKYAYNFYDNGMPILAIHRRLYRAHENELVDKGNPFKADGYYFGLLKKSKLLVNKSQPQGDPRGRDNKATSQSLKDKAAKVFYALFYIMGIERYTKLMKGFRVFSKFENNAFLLKM